MVNHSSCNHPKNQLLHQDLLVYLDRFCSTLVHHILHSLLVNILDHGECLTIEWLSGDQQPENMFKKIYPQQAINLISILLIKMHIHLLILILQTKIKRSDSPLQGVFLSGNCITYCIQQLETPLQGNVAVFLFHWLL
jgi:hypothetical protein